jgi:hypothetical protein
MALTAQASLHFDVDLIPGLIGKPTGINDLGYVVSSAGSRWDGVTTTTLPTASVLTEMSGAYSAGGTSSGGGAIWNDLTKISIGTSRFAYGVNEQGVVAGFQSGTSGDVPIIYDNSVVTVLPLGTYLSGRALRINSAKTAVGWVQNSSGGEFPALWQNGLLTVLSTTTQGTAWGINESGLAAWSSSGVATIHTWQNGVDTSIGTVPSTTFNVLGLNDAGDIASGGRLFHDGVMYNLDTLIDGGNHIGEIWGINNSMQIAASSTLGAVRLTPSVPEPTGLTVLLGGALAIGARRKRLVGLKGFGANLS